MKRYRNIEISGDENIQILEELNVDSENNWW
jgi:hypothetical protein